MAKASTSVAATAVGALVTSQMTGELIYATYSGSNQLVYKLQVLIGNWSA